MSGSNSVARSMHDVGLAAWFGGSLMGAIGLNGAAATVRDPKERVDVATAGWKRWTPVNAAAVGAHLLGGALIVTSNRQRIAGQRGVATWTATKTVLTAAAITTTAVAGWYGRVLDQHPPVEAAGATESTAATPERAAGAQRRLRLLQWATPALTGAMVVAAARMGEQQRPAQVAGGLLSHFIPD